MLALLTLCVLPACKGGRQLTERTTTTEHMELRTTVVPRDTSLLVPASHVSGSVSLPAPGKDLKPHTVRSSRAWSTVAVVNGVVEHSGGCDSTELAATLFDRWTKEVGTKETVHTVYEVRTVTRTPKWAWWALATSIGMVLWRLAPLLLRLIKPL